MSVIIVITAFIFFNSACCSNREILDNVLDLSKLESRMMELKHEPLSLWSICNEIRLLLLPTIPANVRLIVDTERDFWILGDSLRWRQV